ncbi:pimeloyl-ACP methyl ester esterase BioH [Alteromonas sp. ASW11-19]|uniref:Pimeloyl-[acyl-carrier protein] methyl ester esterase n=1 Tax=Alteromonas salexigens TaxID=2982530 RepID=A0ABT2VJU7_9ALTE|nr:pimeloyl-ACP methyl ester esterase BioH [Alteromonas salexigens]MCU7553533.1 pimeloyl-ACP methyl ester esterase BioH [Alteromonas salexigens]
MTESHNSSAVFSRTTGAGKDLVFLHGWGMNSGAFSHFAPYLTDDWRVTLIDLPGFGHSSHTHPLPYHVASIADTIGPLLPDDCVVVGWSLGGLVAQQLALALPKQVSAVITIASTPKFVAAPGWPGIAPEVLAQFERQLETSYRKTLDRFLAIQAMGSETARQDIKAIRSQITAHPDPSPQALEEGLKLLSTEDLRNVIGRINQPTLRIYGRLDSLVPTSAVDMVCELHPQSDTVVMPHAAHAPFISHPQQTADIIRQFLSVTAQRKAS